MPLVSMLLEQGQGRGGIGLGRQVPLLEHKSPGQIPILGARAGPVLSSSRRSVQGCRGLTPILNRDSQIVR